VCSTTPESLLVFVVFDFVFNSWDPTCYQLASIITNSCYINEFFDKISWGFS
jgi:hypothetical protein